MTLKPSKPESPGTKTPKTSTQKSSTTDVPSLVAALSRLMNEHGVNKLLYAEGEVTLELQVTVPTSSRYVDLNALRTPGAKVELPAGALDDDSDLEEDGDKPRVPAWKTENDKLNDALFNEFE